MNRPELLDALRPHPALDALRDEPDVYVVGGAVRDALLGRPAHELDLLVEGDAPAVARRAAGRLGGAAVLHERFGTATVTSPAATFDLVSARTERYPQPGALPEVMPGATVEQDLERRDLTINAMALHLTDARFVAHPRAEEDLDAGVLRVLHDASFRDDPTRMLRAARYAARLGFAVEPHTDALWEEAVRDGAPSTVSGHRLGDELRLLLREPQPAALLELRRHGLGEAVLGLPFSVHVELVPRAMELTPRDGRADLVALAACIGPTATGQEVSAALDRLEFTAAERGIVKAAVTARLDEWPLPDDELWRRLRNRPPEVVALAAALDPDAEPCVQRWFDHVRHQRLSITGDDLVAAGLQGPAVGAALDAAMAAHLRGEAPDRDTQLAAAIRGDA